MRKWAGKGHPKFTADANSISEVNVGITAFGIRCMNTEATIPIIDAMIYFN
jgi:hypothetical protein